MAAVVPSVPGAGVAEGVGVGVGVELTVPEEVVGVVATAAASFSKNMTSSKLGRLPVPHGVALRCSTSEASPPERPVSSMSSAVDLLSDTRVTPSMSCRRAIRRATSRCAGAQPSIVIAGAEMAVRSALPPPPAPVLMSPVSDFSVMSAGMARERSRSACSQSKREPARSLTVCTRALAIESKSA